MWNTKVLTPPPINSYKCTGKSIDVHNLHHILENAVSTLEKQNILHVEGALLSRCLYRIKTKFRNDKAMQAMEKINKALHNYLNFSLASDIKSFLKSLPKTYYKVTYLPTKQMAEYLLVRMQGFAQLMSRIIQTTSETATLMISRIFLGHMWNIAIVVLSMASRVFCICKYLLQECCVWYGTLFAARNQLELYGQKWLEENYTLPEDLMDWLDPLWNDTQLTQLTPKDLDVPIYNLLDNSGDEDDDDVQFCYEYKNDCITIDDDNMEDDIQFVQEFINQSKRRKKYLDPILIDNEYINVDTSESEHNFEKLKTETVVLDDTRDSESSDLQIISGNMSTDMSDLSLLDTSRQIKSEDIGEIISRHLTKLEEDASKYTVTVNLVSPSSSSASLSSGKSRVVTKAPIAIPPMSRETTPPMSRTINNPTISRVVIRETNPSCIKATPTTSCINATTSRIVTIENPSKSRKSSPSTSRTTSSPDTSSTISTPSTSRIITIESPSTSRIISTPSTSRIITIESPSTSCITSTPTSCIAATPSRIVTIESPCVTESPSTSCVIVSPDQSLIKRRRKRRSKKALSQFTIHNIKRRKDLRVFLVNEHQQRKRFPDSCVSKNLDKLQWNMLINAVKRIIREKTDKGLAEAKSTISQFLSLTVP